MKPIIGITANTSPPNDDRRTISKKVELHYLQVNYMQYIEAGGGVPVLVPVFGDSELVPDVVHRLDGLLVTGGVDIDPSLYGEPNTHSKGCNINRDNIEIALVNEFRRQVKPLMGICRGIQVINVAFGGGLYQDIPTQLEGAQRHHRDEDGDEVFHQILLTRKSVLNDIFQSDELRVNSSHHQSVRDVGKGLTVIAAAKDGVIEAVQCPDDRCTIAIQWHPERMLNDELQVELARWFISQAS